MIGTETRTNVRPATTTSTNVTSHAPMALTMRIEVVYGRDGEVASTILEWSAPAPMIVALKD